MNQTFKTIVYTTALNCFLWGAFCWWLATLSFDIGWETAMMVMHDYMRSRGVF